MTLLERDLRFMRYFRLVEIAARTGGWKLKRVYHARNGRSSYAYYRHEVRPPLVVRFSDHRQRECFRPGIKQLQVRLDHWGRGLVETIFCLTRWGLHLAEKNLHQPLGVLVTG